VARAMQERFKEQLELHVHTTDSPEAMAYNLKGSTNIFVNQQWVPLEVATSTDKMAAYLDNILSAET